MTTNQKGMIVGGSLVLGLVVIGGALAMQGGNSTSKKAPVAQRPVSKTELKESNGKNGKPCYVALSGVVYEIESSAYWKNGEHTTSEGQAYCGADLTDVIGKSPHGTSKLSTLTKIGSLGE